MPHGAARQTRPGRSPGGSPGGPRALTSSPSAPTPPPRCTPPPVRLRRAGQQVQGRPHPEAAREERTGAPRRLTLPFPPFPPPPVLRLTRAPLPPPPSPPSVRPSAARRHRVRGDGGRQRPALRGPLLRRGQPEDDRPRLAQGDPGPSPPAPARPPAFPPLTPRAARAGPGRHHPRPAAPQLRRQELPRPQADPRAVRAPARPRPPVRSAERPAPDRPRPPPARSYGVAYWHRKFPDWPITIVKY